MPSVLVALHALQGCGQARSKQVQLAVVTVLPTAPLPVNRYEICRVLSISHRSNPAVDTSTRSNGSASALFFLLFRYF